MMKSSSSRSEESAHSAGQEVDRSSVSVNGEPQELTALQLGHECLRQGRLEEAERHYHHALQLNPGSVESYQSLAEVFNSQGRLEEAANCYRQAIELLSSATPEEVVALTYPSTPSDAQSEIEVEQLKTLLEQAEAASAARQWNVVMNCCEQLLQLQPSAKTYKLLGNALQAEGNVEEAVQAYTKALQLQPNWAEVYANLGSLKAQQQQWQPAIDHYQQAITLKPDFAGAYRNLARIWVQLNQTDQARQCWYEAFRLEPDKASPEAHFDLGNQLLEQGDRAAAIVCYRHAVQQDPNFAAAYQQLAVALNPSQTAASSSNLVRSTQSPAQSTVVSSQPTRSQPNSAEQWVDLGTAYAEQQQWEKARSCYQKALQLDAKQAAAHWNLAEVWEAMQNSIAAADAKYQALMLEPTWATPAEHLALGHRLFSQDRLDLAADCYLRVTQLQPSDADAFYGLGEVLVRQGQFRDALIHYQQAIKLEPNRSAYYRSAAQALIRLEAWSQAQDCCQQLIRLEPANAQHYLALAEVANQQGQIEQALQACRQLVELQPTCWEAHHKIGDLLARQQQWESAVASFQRSIDLNPQFSWSHNNLGDALLRLERWQAAADAFEQAISLKSDFYWSHYNLGEACIHLGYWERAVASYRKALALNPDLPRIQQKLGNALRHQGEAILMEALNCYRRAIEQDPDDVENYHYAIDLQPDNAALYQQLAHALNKQGNTAGAMIFQQMVYQLQSGSSMLVTPIEEATSGKKKLAASRDFDPAEQTDPQALNQSAIVSNDSYVPEIENADLPETDIRLIAFYLPQFHPIPENDVWWGKGFTEWTNVTKARPLFAGHYQPHLPSDLGFYDLRLPEVREAQAALAKKYGIHGFCYYYYWFAGKRLLERPLDDMLHSKKPDFPFCICWANENWTRRWDGQEDEILIAQEHSPEMNRAFAESVVPYLLDERYIRINGKPLLIVYRANILPDPGSTQAQWRQVFREHGVGEVHLCAALTFGFNDPVSFGFDSGMQFPPHGLAMQMLPSAAYGLEDFSGRIFHYEQEALDALRRKLPDYTLFPTVMTSWDNTPRRKKAGTVFVKANPEIYEFWLRGTIAKVQQQYQGDERLVFVNAWNEWAEGAHLEPDQKYGHAYLLATRNALTQNHSWKTDIRLLRYFPWDSAPEPLERCLQHLYQILVIEKPDLDAFETQEIIQIRSVEHISNSDTHLLFYFESLQAGAMQLGDLLSVSGWILSQPYSAVAIEVVAHDELVAQIPVDIKRDDVNSAYPDFPNHPSNAFAGQVDVTQIFSSQAIDSVVLTCQALLQNGSTVSLIKVVLQQEKFGWLQQLKSLPNLTATSTQLLLEIEKLLNPNLHSSVGRSDTFSSLFNESSQQALPANSAVIDLPLTQNDSVQKPVLFVLHDLYFAGAQLFLIRFLEWIHHHQPALKFEVLINLRRDQISNYGDKGAKLLERLAQVSVVHFIDASTQQPENISQIHQGIYSVLYVNTAVLGELLDSIGTISTPIIVHVHELDFWITQRLGIHNFKRYLKYNPQFIACSQAVRNSLIKLGDIHPEKISLVHAFVPVRQTIQSQTKSRQAIRKELGLTEDVFVLVGCGTLDARKGTDLLIPLVKSLKQKLLSDRFACVWVGSASYPLPEQELRIAIQQNALERNLILVGHQDCPMDYFNAANVFILPSREDPFPLVMLEAATCKLPVIGFEGSGGVTEFVESDAGFTVPYLDVDEMAKRIAQLYDSPMLVKQMGEAAFKKVTQLYNEDVLAPKIIDLIYQMSLQPACSN